MDTRINRDENLDEETIDLSELFRAVFKYFKA